MVNALDDKSIQEALTNLRNNKDFVGLKNSALARSRADWLVGMNLSRAYSIKAQQAGYQGFSVGRVLTPTMALVVRRENEIKSFKPTIHFQAEVIWNHENGSILTVWKPKEDSLFLDGEGRILDQKICDDLTQRIKNELSVIQTVEKKKKQERQRLPYSLSALQIDAGKKYGYNPQQVLDIMQELYEKKLTTYPRSDCDYLPENQISDVEEILNHLKFITRENFHKLIIHANQKIRSCAWNDKKYLHIMQLFQQE